MLSGSTEYRDGHRDFKETRGMTHLGLSLKRWLRNYQVEKGSEVAQSCPTLCDPMDWGLPGFSVHGIFQARVLEWVAISFSRGSSWPRDRTQVSGIVGRCFTLWATREATRKNQRTIQQTVTQPRRVSLSADGQHQFSSVTLSCPTLWDSMDCSIARVPYPSPTPGACSNLYPWSWWCHPTISSFINLLPNLVES